MRLTRRFLPLLLISILVPLAAAASVAADPGQATVEHFKTDGIAQSFFGGCDFEFPPAPLSCHETEVVVFKEGFNEGGLGSSGVAPPKTPWVITVDDYTVTYATGGPDAVPTFSDERSGFLLNPSVTFDQPHLSFLSVSAQVPMDDGSTFTFQGTWRSTSGVMQFGNDGPSLVDFGRVPHYVDTCTTVNSQAHQKFVSATMSGTLNGVPVHSYRNLDIDFMAYNQFVYLDVQHGDC